VLGPIPSCGSTSGTVETPSTTSRTSHRTSLCTSHRHVPRGCPLSRHVASHIMGTYIKFVFCLGRPKALWKFRILGTARRVATSFAPRLPRMPPRSPRCSSHRGDLYKICVSLGSAKGPVEISNSQLNCGIPFRDLPAGDAHSPAGSARQPAGYARRPAGDAQGPAGDAQRQAG
jgi:hypothetical protein